MTTNLRELCYQIACLVVLQSYASVWDKLFIYPFHLHAHEIHFLSSSWWYCFLWKKLDFMQYLLPLNFKNYTLFYLLFFFFKDLKESSLFFPDLTSSRTKRCFICYQGVLTLHCHVICFRAARKLGLTKKNYSDLVPALTLKIHR